MQTSHAARWRHAPRLLLILLIPLLVSACAGSRTPSTSWPGLSATEQTAFVAFGPAIYAVDLESAEQNWAFEPQGEQATTFFAPQAIMDGEIVFAGSYDGGLYSLDATTGELIWSKQLAEGRIVGSPTVADGMVYVPSSDRNLYAVDSVNGREIWKFPAEGPIWASPLVEDGTVYVASLDHKLYALDAENGRLLWETELQGAMADRPASFNGLLVLGTFGESLNAISKETGAIAWMVPTSDWVWGNPTVSEDVAYFGDVGGNLYAIDEEGRVIWQETLGSQIAASPAINDGVLFVLTEAGDVFARNIDGNSSLWKQRIEGRLLADPIVVGDLLLVSSFDGDQLLTALNTSSGTIRWTYQPAEE